MSFELPEIHNSKRSFTSSGLLKAALEPVRFKRRQFTSIEASAKLNIANVPGQILQLLIRSRITLSLTISNRAA
jgi:hypothetical protein